jgi:ABC-type nitrate/sulfonate/bicarbonate transport system permease component
LKRLDPPPLVLLGLLAAAWELGPALLGSANFPRLSAVLAALWDNGAEITLETLHTLRRAGIGLLLAAVTMIPFGILIGRTRWLAAIFEPIIDLLRPLPPIAIVPVVTLFAGIGDGAKISVIAYAASFPILIHAIDGVRGIHPMYATVSKALRLTRTEARFGVDLQAALPVLFTGLRLAIANALLVAVTAEMLLSSDGLGLFIMKSQERFRIADGVAGILVVAVLGWSVNRLLLACDQHLLAWHYATTGELRRE